jgi:wyosine [tRNA(Phe)-imidazoG37] synthetase (radical SAM superfamily)
MISFGPVPSRRLGKSLGINNIPSRKVCSYSCIYCQVGITKSLKITRENFYSPEVVFSEVKNHLGKLQVKDKPDYLTFVANGEPTLDINFGKSILKLKEFKIPVAVITNGSLLTQQQVREDLNFADWVSIKVDANNEFVWRTINQPHENLDFKQHVESLLKFSSEFKGKLATETMLVNGVNDNSEIINQTADLIAQIKPFISYISVPTRPPAVSLVKVPYEPAINEAYQIFDDKGLKTELLLGFEGTDTGYTGNAIEDIINISTVHPIREDTMLELLKKDNADSALLDSLIYGQHIQRVKYKEMTFYIRKFHI